MKRAAAFRENTAAQLTTNQSRQTNESYQEKQIEIDANFLTDPYERNSPTAADDAALEIALERGDA